MSATKTAHGHGAAHDTPVDASVGHETTDAHVRPLVFGVVITFAVLIVSYLIIAGIMALLGSAPNDLGASNYVPPPAEAGTRLPTGPLLQQDGDADGDRYVAEQTELLESYAVDPSSGRVRIPVERAMELVIERGIGGGPGE